MGRPSFRRRQFFIKKEFQWKFILLYFFLVAGISAVIAFLLFLQMGETLEALIYSSHPKVGHTGEFLTALMLKTNVTSLALIGCCVLMVSLVIFNRMNKNFSRMEECVEGMSEGDFSKPISKGSRFNEISNLNDLLRQIQLEYHGHFKEISETVKEMERGCEGKGDLEMLRSGESRLRKVLEKIHLP